MSKKIKLGDAIAKLTKVLGIPHCEKCEQRRMILNQIQELGMKETIRKMSALNKTNIADEDRALKEVVAKLTDCCKE